MVDVIRQRPMSILHPYMIEAYVAVDGSEACLSLNPPNAFCARDGAVKEVRLELEFKRYETHEDKIRDIQIQRTAGLHHSGERIREDTLAVFSPICYHLLVVKAEGGEALLGEAT
jgi:hypothetical protein